MTEQRPPVVAILGHVDHGKTTLLDFIRKANVAAREAGGITQSVGAYEIVHHDKKITFIDTPGHEAFSHMRARGASVADLVILVVAADDGVKPQTKEALSAITATGTPYLIAINKVDKPGANVEKTRQELANAGVLLEGYGGSVTWLPVSAKTGEGVPELLDLILLASDLEGLTFDRAVPASGVVLSSSVDPRRGVLAGVVVTNGVLRQGAFIATETAQGKVKAMVNFLGKPAKELEPSAPALLGGFVTPPQVGEVFTAGEEADARAFYKEAIPTRVPLRTGEISPEVAEGMPLILKADEAGSLEALVVMVTQAYKDTPCRIVEKSVGNIYEGDVKLAESTGATILGFGIKADRAAANLAEGKRVTIVMAPVIYDLEKFIKETISVAAKGTGAVLEVLKVFGAAKGKAITKRGETAGEQIIGGRVMEGVLKNRALFSLLRGVRVMGEGQVVNLQSNKKDVPEVNEGQEAGMLVECAVAIQSGDLLRFEP